jgi:hypothetical protein
VTKSGWWYFRTRLEGAFLSSSVTTDRDGVQSYLRHIWYNSPVTGESQEPRDGCGSPGDFACYGHHVELQYEARPDPIVSYGSGFRVETNWRLIR